MEKQVRRARQKRTRVEIDVLKGCMFTSITGMEEQSIAVLFSGERSFFMLHESDCCEQVFLADVCGDPNDLVGTPIVEACQISSDGTPPHADADVSWTWTFYRLSTIKGTVVLRWFGTSNGYYSEEVELYELQKQERGKRQAKGEIKEDVWLDLAHPRHLRTELDWDYLAAYVGVGPAYLREVLTRRRNGSLPLLKKIALQLGKNAAARRKIFRLLTGAVDPR